MGFGTFGQAPDPDDPNSRAIVEVKDYGDENSEEKYIAIFIPR